MLVILKQYLTLPICVLSSFQLTLWNVNKCIFRCKLLDWTVCLDDNKAGPNKDQLF